MASYKYKLYIFIFQLSYPDASPYMVMSEASVELLNTHLKKPVSVHNFRPNIVISGCEANSEVNSISYFFENDLLKSFKKRRTDTRHFSIKYDAHFQTLNDPSCCESAKGSIFFD